MQFSTLFATALFFFTFTEAAPHGGRHGDRPHRGRPERPGLPDNFPKLPPGLFPPSRNRTGSDRPGRGRGRGRHGIDFHFPTGIIPTGIIPSGRLPTDIFPTDILPTELPTDLPSGIFPTGGLPTGIFPTGGLPTSTLSTTLVPGVTSPMTEAPTSTSVGDIETVSFVFPSSSAGIPIPPGARPAGGPWWQ